MANATNVYLKRMVMKFHHLVTLTENEWYRLATNFTRLYGSGEYNVPCDELYNVRMQNMVPIFYGTNY